MGQSGSNTKGLTDKERAFVTEVTAYVTQEVKRGVTVFVVLAIKDDPENGKFNVQAATVDFDKTKESDELSDSVYKLVEKFMDAYGTKVHQN